MIREHYPFQFVKEQNNCFMFKLRDEPVEIRFFVLEEDIFRVLIYQDDLKLDRTWCVAPGFDDIPFEGRDRLDISPFTLPPAHSEQDGNYFYVMTKKMKAEINLDGFKISWYFKKENDWIPIARDRQTQAYNLLDSLGEGIFHYMERTADEQYYGLGEKTGNVNRYGRRFRMLNMDPMGYDAETTDPLYKHIPFYITRNMEKKYAYGLFYDNLATSVIDFGKEKDNYHGPFRYYHAEGGDLDYYFILGPSVAEVVEKFSWLTGRTAFPPKWSLGYSGSTMTYTESPNSQTALQEFVDSCEQHDILCYSFQLSSGYTTLGNKRCVFHWDRSKFPDPKALTRSFHNKGLKLCANIKPCLLTVHPDYDLLKYERMFVESRDGKEPEISQFWDGLGSYLDFTNPKTINWWKSSIKKNLLAYGIDSTWNDNNEYEIWDSKAKANGFGKTIEIGLIRPLQTLLMIKSSYEAQLEYSPNERPYLISRSGCPGMQRYAQTWSGDNYTEWKTLRYNIRMGIGLSLSGIYNFGHDVGGFAGPAPEPELFVRWVQNGIFHPRFTIHSWNDDGTVNEPWMYPEVIPFIRKLIKFRNMITPYLYQCLYEAHQHCKPIVRPTFYNFEHDPNTFKENDDFMLGDSLLVASVVDKNSYEREIYLPEHEGGWYNFHTGEWYPSGTTVIIPAPLDYTPLMVMEGAIVPVNDAEVSFSDKFADERGFYLFPYQEKGESVFHLFEDDGVSYGYRDGYFTFLHVRMICAEDQIKIEVEKEGNYSLPYKDVRFYLPDGEKRPLLINGKMVPQKRRQVYEVAIP
ncbi:alpha-glucosidase [Caldalkalibacillus uzonensis]|uniref:Alpha-glucosidase n=1 Tax=Caldalkalibacillus uzonensis TaxID=353224 RepID=A0ABU0CPC4_9BACI|nr:glycoside hydrolase family 31 protein [Caldalkalibacillus uzonensis]MDQ0338261.1 alpha-glucosidase [Caldalkalibacillus uzonensis]